MTEAQAREAARQFFYKWQNKGKEDEHSHLYWLGLLQDVLGMDKVSERVEFEKKVIGSKGSTERIDVYIPETRVIIEQKSLGIALDKPQAGHDGKTPYEQAKGYDNYLPYEERARWIVLSNFAEIWIYDLNERKPEPVKLSLEDLQTKFHLLDFLINKKKKEVTEEVELSKAAGELVGKIRDRFLQQYNDPLAKRTQKSLNILCVRLVFCFYAEDAGLFGEKDAFCNYLMQYQPKDMRNALLELFRVLDTPLDERADMYLADELAAFPYVNGGLFSDENIVIPKITQDIKDTLIESSRFDWSKISPTIFGAVFESTLNPETRRAGGMHYTSIENIHKIIDPLFLDALREELEDIKKISVPGVKIKKLNAFQDKLASLIFFDPACGSGNFLTESYLSLRRLENDVIRLKVEADKTTFTGQVSFGFEVDSPIKVSIHQFYGIEINDFAVSVAQTALWIAESQTMQETEGIIHTVMDFFPLKAYKGITEGNALRIDWNKACPVDRLSYIIGNPPFVGSSIMAQNSPQKDDIHFVFPELNKNDVQDLDYVCCWYKRAAECMQGNNIECCLVSTNSVCQGSQVPILWGTLFKDYKIHINFAYQTFKWNSESSDQAAVHCVIISFSTINKKNKAIYNSDGQKQIVSNISPYLTDGPEILVLARKKALCDVPVMNFGNQPRDGGFLVIKTEDELNEILSSDPSAASWIHTYLGAVEFINNKKRWCLWLKHATPVDLKKSKVIYQRVEEVRKFRLDSRAKTTNGYAKVPHLFAQITQPEGLNYLIIPRVSSERRRYIPIGFMDANIIASDAVQIVPGATLYHFGILTSNVHMSWMRTVAGRLKSDYRYSKEIVYNNFPWPSPSDSQKQKIEQTAQGILNARALYPDSSLADLYDPLAMPSELRKAHQLNDKAVMQAYGMPIKDTDEAACVAWLMKMYQEISNGK